MPVVSRFLGIIIAMYWDDHAPPHFHAKYAEYEITVNIRTGVVEGKFPKRALRHVLEWYEIHTLSAPDGMIVSRRRREICQSEV
ncbi:transcriptional regulator, partial [Methylococcaceae bacterium CS5]